MADSTEIFADAPLPWSVARDACIVDANGSYITSWPRHEVVRRVNAHDALVAALEKFAAVNIRNWTHNEECGRSDDCEDVDATHPCERHDIEDGCPDCECGMSKLFAADDECRAALLAARSP